MNKTTYEIFSVENEQDSGGGPHWIVGTIKTDGVTHYFKLPHISFVARAAEYGIDPEDIEILLDICLHELFNGIDHTHPDFFIHNSEERARSALLQRTKAVKDQHEVTDPKGLLKTIKDHHVKNPNRAFHKSHQNKISELRKQRKVL